MLGLFVSTLLIIDSERTVMGGVLFGIGRAMTVACAVTKDGLPY